jgi:hypothetical protein
LGLNAGKGKRKRKGMARSCTAEDAAGSPSGALMDGVRRSIAAGVRVVWSGAVRLVGSVGGVAGKTEWDAGVCVGG